MFTNFSTYYNSRALLNTAIPNSMANIIPQKYVCYLYSNVTITGVISVSLVLVLFDDFRIEGDRAKH